MGNLILLVGDPANPGDSQPYFRSLLSYNYVESIKSQGPEAPVSTHEYRCIEEMKRMNPLVTIEKLTDALEVSASEFLK